jgi:hypothetical protein
MVGRKSLCDVVARQRQTSILANFDFWAYRPSKPVDPKKDGLASRSPLPGRVHSAVPESAAITSRGETSLQGKLPVKMADGFEFTWAYKLFDQQQIASVLCCT